MPKQQPSALPICPMCKQPHPGAKLQSILDQLPPRGYIRQKLLNELLPFSSATLWRKVAAGEFPKPHKISERVTGWRVEDVRQWFIDKGLVN